MDRILFQPRGLIEPAEIVLTLGIRLHREDPQTLEKRYRAMQTQIEPREHRSDLIFMDPVNEGSAAKLIAQAELPGKTIGQVRISNTNPNYMLNLGNATTTEVQALIAEVYQKVWERSKVRLQLNVEIR